MKLLGAIVNNQKLGVDKLTWNQDEFSGTPFQVIEDNMVIPNGFADISSILSWGKLSEVCNLTYVEIRNEIKKLLPSNLETLSQEVKVVLEYYNLYNYFKIYDRIYDGDMILSINPPIDIDYDLMGYHKNRIFDKGELVKVVYYENYNPFTNVYSGRAVEELRTYYRVNEMLNRRDMTINWILSNDTTGFTKTTRKYYTMLEAIQGGETRRANLISDLKITVIGLIMAASGATAIEAQNAGRPFLDTYAMEIAKFIQGFESNLKDAILNDSVYSWLNFVIPNTGGITVRQYLISELTIDYTINNTYI